MYYLIAYDIENNKIRNKIAKYLEKKGKRIQKSVFLLDINLYVLKKLKSDLEKLNNKNGVIHLFRICSKCKKEAQYIGEKQPLCIIC
ncbi:MAG: CRISPR-associated endonuclease Cas2 [Candidatus Atribacteria bacterium]|nr:CRISPR-associated endonuclease Cas2 [Candidatus Atribacteria bacterium]